MMMIAKPDIPPYPYVRDLKTVCQKFAGQSVRVTHEFMGESAPVDNINIVGDLLEDVFFPHLKKNIPDPDFKRGPPNAYPDFHGGAMFGIEQKVFIGKPGFDVGHFQSYVNQLAEEEGVMKKLFRTIYTVYEYEATAGGGVTIKQFHLLNVWSMVGYGGKSPISMQNKHGVWEKIRPCAASGWYDTEKTPQRFIEAIVDCIRACGRVSDADSKIKSILDQFADIQSKYNIESHKKLVE